MTFHDYFPEKPQFRKLGIGLKHLELFSTAHRNFAGRWKKCIYFLGFFSGKDEEAP